MVWENEGCLEVFILLNGNCREETRKILEGVKEFEIG